MLPERHHGRQLPSGVSASRFGAPCRRRRRGRTGPAHVDEGDGVADPPLGTPAPAGRRRTRRRSSRSPRRSSPGRGRAPRCAGRRTPGGRSPEAVAVARAALDRARSPDRASGRALGSGRHHGPTTSGDDAYVERRAETAGWPEGAPRARRLAPVDDGLVAHGAPWPASTVTRTVSPGAGLPLLGPAVPGLASSAVTALRGRAATLVGPAGVVVRSAPVDQDRVPDEADHDRRRRAMPAPAATRRRRTTRRPCSEHGVRVDVDVGRRLGIRGVVQQGAQLVLERVGAHRTPPSIAARWVRRVASPREAADFTEPTEMLSASAVACSLRSV